MPDNNSNASQNNSLKPAAQFIPVLITALLAGAVIFYKERMLFIDAPHVLFRIINDGSLKISDFRYGSFITQIFPLLGARLHLPLRWLMILYSASFYLFYLTVALLLVYKFKNYGLALLFGLYLILFVSDTYYWPNNEVHQGIGWLMLALAANFCMAQSKWPLWIALPLFIASFYLAIWTHPLVMMVAVYLWFLFMMDKALWPYSRLQTLIYTAILLILSFFKFNQGRRHGYDSTKIEVITGFHQGGIRAIFTSPQTHFFIKNCFTNYWLFLILFILGIISLVRAKKYLPLAWTLLFAGGYLALVFITFWDGGNRFYIESEYMPLSLICVAPFVYYTLPKLNGRAGITVILFICIVRLVYIFDASHAFTNRITIMNKINDSMREKNLTKIIIAEPVPGIDSALIMNWGAPVESILLSALKGENPQRTFIFAGGDELKNDLKIGKDTLIGCWDLRPPSKINHYYFQVDTTVGYKVVSYSELMSPER